MTALNFPASPTVNQTYTFNGRTYIWNGTVWNAVGQSISTGATGGTSVTSGTDVTLTSSSTQVQLVTMTAASQNVILPSATTLSKGESIFEIAAAATSFAFSIKNSAGTLVYGPVYAGTTVQLSLADNSAAAGVWTANPGVTAKGAYGPMSVSAISVTSSNIWRIAPLSATTALFIYTGSGETAAYAVVMTLSGTTFTFGTPLLFYNQPSHPVNDIAVAALSSTLAVVVTTAGIYMNTVAFSISGSTITAGGSVNQWATYNYAPDSPRVLAMSATEAIVSSQSNYVQNGYNYGYAWPVTVSGTTLSFGTAFGIANTDGSNARMQLVKTASGSGALVYTQLGVSKVAAFTLASNVLTVGAAQTVQQVNYTLWGAGNNYTQYSPAANVALFTLGSDALTVTTSGTTVSSYIYQRLNSGWDTINPFGGAGQALYGTSSIMYANSGGWQGAYQVFNYGTTAMQLQCATMLDSSNGVAVGKVGSGASLYYAAQLLKVA